MENLKANKVVKTEATKVNSKIVNSLKNKTTKEQNEILDSLNKLAEKHKAVAKKSINNIKTSKGTFTESKYKYQNLILDFDKLSKDEITKKAKKVRQNLRKQTKSYLDKVLAFFDEKENLLLIDTVKEFNSYYKNSYSKNDYSVESIFSIQENTTKANLQEYQKFLDICKSI